MATRNQILIVEDNELNREVLGSILADRYRVLEASNGQEALDLLADHKDEVSLILLDIMMPVMDGYTFLARVKADPDLSLIPVIVTTQSDKESDEVEALAAGATDFVPKPYRPQVILHRVASIISLRETAAMVNQFKFDRLTGLLSKAYFCQCVRETLDRNPGKRYDLVCSNIENFKLFNDAFGTSAGDRLLRDIARLATEGTQGRGVCGRESADRFVYLWERPENGYDTASFRAFTERINVLSGRAANVVVRWGVYQILNPEVPVEQMCDRAFLAAGEIKGRYDAYYAFYDNELRGRMLREQAITDAMETALDEGQFEVYLQPKYSLATETMVGAEALVRWTHPELGFISPGEFIPLFEKNGFISRLDRFVWERTCSLMEEWNAQGYQPLPISVNISRADAFQADLVGTLLDMAHRHGLQTAQLHLEITETAYTENTAQIMQVVDQLRALGFVIEMDDFGSGYSSLNILSKIKIDILKLDMKFLQSEPLHVGETLGESLMTQTTGAERQGILRFILMLARWMGLGVVAEGVETRSQLDYLREIGCDYVQGYYFARPMPADRFAHLLAQVPADAVPLRSRRPRDGADLPCMLVADPDPAYRALVRDAFEGMYDVIEAADCPATIVSLGENSERVVVVLLNMALPSGGGAAVLKTLSSNHAMRQIAVLAVAEEQDAGLEDAAYAAQADDFAVKPHSAESLRRRVSQLLRLRNCHEHVRALREEAFRDDLTGLLNRRGLRAGLDQIGEHDLPVAVYLFDLDNLKQVNDTSGHAAGDELILSFCSLLKRSTRSSDLLGRHGGDEFVVVMRHMPGAHIALRKGRTICRDFAASCADDGPAPSCSAGIVWYEGGENLPLSALIDRADAALYQAKREHKGGCCLWGEECDEEHGGERGWECGGERRG